MALHYQTEYRLGHRGRVCRSYTGFQAFVAIALDLVFGLLFEAVSAAIVLAARLTVLVVRAAVEMIELAWWVLVAAMTLAIYLVTLPFALIHEVVDRLRSGEGREPAGDSTGPRPQAKPSWALGREV